MREVGNIDGRRLSLAEINRHLFYQLDLDQFGFVKSAISDSLPFELTLLGEVRSKDTQCPVYEFFHAGRRFLFTDDSCGTILSVESGLTLDDLQLKIDGEEWIRNQKPVDLNVSVPTDDSIPSSLVRRERINELVRTHLPGIGDYRIIEGYFLKASGASIALVEENKTGQKYTLLTGHSPLTVEDDWYPSELGISHALAFSVGTLLKREGEIGKE
jgi:hypothetical protein